MDNSRLSHWCQPVQAQALLEWHSATRPSIPLKDNTVLVALAHDAIVRQERETGRLATVLNGTDPGLLGQ